MKSIVTGGAGFIGSTIVDALLERGDEVLIVDDFSTGRDSNLDNAKKDYGSKLTIVKKDICELSLMEDFEAFKPDVVFHTAAQINVRKSVAEPGFDAEKNVAGTVNILEAARRGGAKRFVFSSTGGAIYGEQESFPASEEHPNKPESQYGVGKRAAELYLELYARKFDMTVVSLRYSNVFGPRQNAKGEAGVVAIFTDKLVEEQSLKVNGDGKQTRDFVYVGDVTAANLAVSGLDRPGELSVYNVGRGVEISVLDVVNAFKKVWPEHCGSKCPDVKFENGPALPGEQMRSVIDSGRLQKEFGWSAPVDLEQGLVHTIKSVT